MRLVSMMTKIRGSSNPKAKSGLGVYLAGYGAGTKHSVEVPDERTG